VAWLTNAAITRPTFDTDPAGNSSKDERGVPDEGDVQTADGDRGQVGVADVTATRAASSKTTTAFVPAMRFASYR
jgi:hypothetical protein